MANRMFRCTVVLLLAVLTPLQVRADEVVDRARQLMAERNPKAAYQLLAPLQSERAGDPEFDYLLGIASLDVGRNTEAVFALERVLAVQPNNAQARAEIARAYLQLRETDAARREFENVKAQNPPAEVIETIDRYLSAIALAPTADKPTARFYVEGFGGHDSNVNSATGDRNVAIPVFGGAVFSLAPSATQQSDLYAGVQAGASARMPINGRWALIAGFTANRRFNQDYRRFDTGFLDFSFGTTYKRNRDLFTLLAQFNDFTVNDPIYSDTYREARGFTAQWQRDLNATNQISFYVQYAGLAYPDQPVRNADRYVVGGAFAHAFRRGPVVYAGLYAGEERERTDNRPYLGHEFVGLRVGGDYSLSDHWTVFANAFHERRRYGGEDPFFQIGRRDNQTIGAVGVHYVPAKDWRITPQLLGFQNDSNIVVSKFDRTVAEVRVRRDF
ncbi:MAG: DUF560 domain-containing protein [Burkholderiales bacterium]|nr:DUF560 domain-containing protein [Burkholderiales bacterium]